MKNHVRGAWILAIALFFSTVGCASKSLEVGKVDTNINGAGSVAPTIAPADPQNRSVDAEKSPEEIVGGERDVYGCLGPAGYNWDEEIGACIRSWELKDASVRKAAKIAVQRIGQANGLTVLACEAQNCTGCFKVTLTKGDEQMTVDLVDWVVPRSTPQPE